MILKDRRKALGLTQEELARIVGISSRSILRHEAGLNQSPAIERLLEGEFQRMEKKFKGFVGRQIPENN